MPLRQSDGHDAVVLDRTAFLRRSGGLVAAAATLDWVAAVDAVGGVDPRLRSLARAVDGPVLTPASAGYEAARVPFNSRYAGLRPLAVVQPRSIEDVRRTVLWARRNHVRLAARSGGHSYGGYSTTSGVVVDLRRLSAVHVDVRNRTATVGAGARLIDVVSALARRGVAIPHGSCPTVGVGGLALGGGVGFASRAWGTTSDNTTALGIVTADGRWRRGSARAERDLFWACRGGGGGNFGIATGFTFRVHPVSNVSWFVASWPWEQVEQVVAAWQSFAPEAPAALFSICSLGTGASTPTVQCLGQLLGPEATLQSLLAPLRRVDGIRLRTGTSTYFDAQLRWAGCLGETTAECREPRRSTFAAKSDYANRPLAGAGIAVLREAIERGRAAGVRGSILLDSYGGALNRPAPAATAFVHRDALFSFQELAYWTAGGGEAALAWLRRLHADLRPHVSGFAYQNYIDPELADWRNAYYGENYARLAAVKRRVDPDRFFRFKQAIG